MADEEQLNFWDWIAMRHKEEDEKQSRTSISSKTLQVEASKTEDES
jgi:hypothetical protein